MQRQNSLKAPIAEYRVSKGWKAFFTILVPPLAALMAFLALFPFLERRSDETVLMIFCLALGGGFFFLFLYALVFAYTYRLEIAEDRLRSVGVFRTRAMAFADIAGFRLIAGQYAQSLEFTAKTSGAKKLRVDLVFRDRDGLLAWANEHFRDLGAEELEKEDRALLADTSLGSSQEARKEAIARARLWSKAVNIAGGALTVYGFFWPTPYRLSVGLLVAWPLVSALAMYFHRGLITFDQKKNAVLPSVALGFLLPTFALALRAILDWNILEWRGFWPPFACISAATFALVFASAKDVRAKRFSAILPLAFCCVYGYGTTLALNGLLDSSRPAVYEASILDKRSSSGRSTSYYLELSPWGPRTKSEEVSVAASQYREAAIGEKIEVESYEGSLGIPWFKLSL
jgi:hypothetical protein